MTRILFLVTICLSFTLISTGQCPSLNLSSSSGSTCGTNPVTISGNTFEHASKVTIHENGAGSVNEDSENKSPFSFTYTPRIEDLGKTVTITISTNNPPGSCNAAVATYELLVNRQPSSPLIGDVTQPTCQTPGGSVVIGGLPSGGVWTLNRVPGNVVTTGSGASTLISNLSSGSFNFTVTDEGGCVSGPSSNVSISSGFSPPSAPHIVSIVSPTCIISTGSLTFDGLPSEGWTLTRSPGNVLTSGTGTNTSVVNIPSGTYTYTVTNLAGCVSPASGNAVVPPAPIVPPPPVIGAITQPLYESPAGKVVVSGLPGAGDWTLTLTPGSAAIKGSGSVFTITGLVTGIYNISVTNSSGCTSGLSSKFEINKVTGPPLVKVSNPPPVCAPSTVDITSSQIISGSTNNIMYTFWTDANATQPFKTPGTAKSGTYYIKGTTTDGFSTIKPVIVTVYDKPIANAGPDQTLKFVFNAKLNATLKSDLETGLWTLVSGTGLISDNTNPNASVMGLSLGKNVFAWTITNGVCPSVSDTLVINILDFMTPTLITPNNDGKNDFLILTRPSVHDKVDLIIFDRRGLEVYKNSSYDNTWAGQDMKGNQLPEDTYFFVMKTSKGTSTSGFVIIRR